MTQITALFFDIGDVLVNIDWQRSYRKMLGHTKHADGRLFSIEEISAKLHPNTHAEIWDNIERGHITHDQFISEVCAHTGYTGDLDLLATILADIFTPLVARIALLNTLIEQGNYKVVLISDTNPMHATQIEKTITDIFKNIPDHHRYYSYRIGMKKRLGKDIYQHVLNDLGLQPHQALMIDDRIQNKVGADEIGLPFLHILKEQDLAAALRAEPYNLVF